MNSRRRTMVNIPPRLRGNLIAASADRHKFLVGAAIGTGMAAQSAMRGGADFLLALSAGRMRCMGEPSIAAMLPLQESNALVMNFARSEILPRTTVPVFFGAATFDPRIDLAALVDEIVDAGFSGVANFPTAILIDGTYRQFLEDEGLGFKRELELLEIARDRGLASLAYIHTLEEAQAAAECGIDIVNIDLGWNMGGVMGVDSDLRIDEAALMTNSIARAVRSISPATRCVVEGGPIVSPRQLEELCQIARVDGYIGGSTIDRVPSESAIEVVTAAFKAIGALHQRIDGLERQIDRRWFPRSLSGHSPAAENARMLFARLAATDHPVLIVGEPGTGRREVARALHASSRRKGRDLIAIPCSDPSPERIQADLFGCMAGARVGVSKNRIGWLEIARGAAILLDEVDSLDVEVQRALVEAAESGRFWRLGGEDSVDFDVRFLAIGQSDLRAARANAVDSRFVQWIGCFTIVLPPLRERLDDLPALIEETLSLILRCADGTRKRLDPSAYRVLAAYHWPGNLRELTSVLERAALADSGDVIAREHLPPLGTGGGTRLAGVSAFGSEKEWILDGLRHNRFRRGRTADYLGISRKTLYNKMRTYGLAPAMRGDSTIADAMRSAPQRRF
ncbi:MAG: phosphoenolpyruvate hydrolase family protein [Proteobacteria bacterium]|nr:phosphoenolpyruvate hydrolase family protein [Pseudomonadota bacterium]